VWWQICNVPWYSNHNRNEKTLFTCTAPGSSWYTCGAETLSFSRRSKKLPPARILTLSTAKALAVSESLALRAQT
jgi:hypothetical protein